MTPTAGIEVIGGRHASKLTAIVDTGFDEEICIPTRVAVQLGLELIGEQPVEFADGTQRNQLVFAGSVRLFDEAREVQMMLTDSEDALVGTRLLDQFRLSIEFPGGRIKRRGRKTGGEPKRR
jgi:clan AA aspartic protease